MVDLSLLQQTMQKGQPSQKDISQQHFDKIAELVEKEEMDGAAELIQPLLVEGSFDIRLIVYYLYTHFLEEGVKSFSTTLPILSSLLEKHWDHLQPAVRKDRQVENSLSWFFAHILDKLKYAEKQAKEGKEFPLWEQSIALSEKEFGHLLETSRGFQDFFYEKWSRSPTKERVTHLVKRIEDLHPFIFPEKPDTPPTSENIAEATSVPEEKAQEPVAAATPSPWESQAMQDLLLKLKIFEQLVEKKQFFKAAMVAQDISHQIEHFDPCHYFPQIFTGFLALLAKHIGALSDEWQNQESLQWKSLGKLYKTDIDQFVEW
ncbi:MAG: type VI secretion system ImpA family N-terminal domain-containing protein [Verrucomicrobia bacterium]|nr:type VI secretion system ImpA family N-terminal domain-containing protein [Verrucomicrobiota bacterium]